MTKASSWVIHLVDDGKPVTATRGGVIEGREREAAFVDGAWHDDVMMGLLASEYSELQRNT